MDSLSKYRRDRLLEYCLKQGWKSPRNDAEASPSALSVRLGRSVSFWSDRLRGTKTIGAALSREIEEKLELPKYYLDGDEEATDFPDVPMLSAVASAGPGQHNGIVEQLGSLKFTRNFLRSVGVKPSSAGIIQVKGFSMEPTIQDGSLLLVNRDAVEPISGAAFVLVYGEDTLVKRLFKKDGRWIAVSDNQDRETYPDIPIDNTTSVLIIGRAVWMGARL